MNTVIHEAFDKFHSASKIVKEEFYGLSEDQLNWNPEKNSWSIAQCLQHIVLTNKAYDDVFRSIASGNYNPGLWQKLSPFSNFMGKMVKQSVHPENPKKAKTVPKIDTINETFDSAVVKEFEAEQKRMEQYVHKFEDFDLDRIMLSSPLAGFITYNLGDCITIIANHTLRHVHQALRVKNNPDFPKD